MLLRNRVNQLTPRINAGRAFFGHAMSSRTCVRCASVAPRKSVPKRPRNSLSNQARPPRIETFDCSVVSFSASMKSTNSGALASVALPERSSLGMMMSDKTRTVFHSCAVKNFGLYGAAAPASSAARRSATIWLARSTLGADQSSMPASGMAPSAFTASRRLISVIVHPPYAAA